MLQILDNIHSPQLGNQRRLIVWTPDAAAGSPSDGQRFPVIYMHDGQNLFDPATSFAGHWEVSETLQTLEHQGFPAIIVGIDNMGVDRIAEYSPFPDRRHGGGRGPSYLEFIVETVKPLIDHRFPTRSEASATGLLGSSLGGLISLHGCLRHPEVFGLCGAMSPSLWFGDGAVYRGKQSRPRGRFYLDVGTRERHGDWRDRFLFGYGSWRYAADIRKMARWLRRHGDLDAEQLKVVIEPGGNHSEASWKRRLPGALRFLLADFKTQGRAVK